MLCYNSMKGLVMSAFDDFLVSINHNKTLLSQYRKELVSGRGSLIKGDIPQYMDLKLKPNDENESLTDAERVSRLYIHSSASKAEDFGFVFDKEGTEKTMNTVMGCQRISLNGDLVDNYMFIDEEKKNIWNSISANKRRRLIADNINKMVQKTNLQYRMHGDRLHYYVLGKITVTSSSLSGAKQEKKVYPLLLFSCSDTDKLKMTIEVEQTGFINFCLDENILSGIISKRFHGTEVTMNEKLRRDLIGLQQDLRKIEFAEYDSVELDPTFSMIGIVTGFVAEYIDKSWEAILNA